MAEVIRLLCDKCGSEKDVGQYRLSTPRTGLNRTVALDLCAQCAEPIMALEQYGHVVSVARPATQSTKYKHARGAPMRSKIYTQDELDALEKTND